MAKKPDEKKKLPQIPAKTRDTRPPKLPRKVPPIVQEYNEMIIRVTLYERELKKAENSNSIRFTNEKMMLEPTKESFHLLGLEREVIKIYEGLKEKLSLPYPVELLQLDSLYYKDGNSDIYHRLYLLTKKLRELSAGEEWQIKERELLNASLQPGQGEGKDTGTSNERQKRNSLTLKVKSKQVELTEIEALCLQAYQTAQKKGTTHITTDVIVKKVWPDQYSFLSKGRIKTHWHNLKKKLGKKGITISDFRMKDINGVRNYQLERPPTWLKNIHFPKTLRPIRA